MMEVQSVGTDTHEGDDIFIWSGAVFKLEGSGAGPTANFLGDITAHRVGRGEWKIRVDYQITKGVRPEEATRWWPRPTTPRTN